MTPLSFSPSDLGHFTGGECRQRFEERFAQYIGTEHAVAVNSAASAMQLVARALELDGEVIVPASISPRSLDALISAGVTPVLADLHPQTLTVDPQDVARKMTLRTQGIVASHMAGQAADIIALEQMAAERDCPLIEESDGGIGTSIDEHKAGSFGIGCFHLGPGSTVTTGEGGIITTSDGVLAARLRQFAGYETNTTEAPGFELRLADLNAAVGSMQLGRLDESNTQRRQRAATLAARLGAIEELRLPLERPGTTHVYQRYFCQVDGADRDGWVEELTQRGIDAEPAPTPVHLLERYRQQGFHAYPLPGADHFARTAFTLPVYADLTPEQLERLGTSVIETAQAIAKETPTAAELLEWWEK